MVDFEDWARTQVKELLSERGFEFIGEKQPHNAFRVAEETAPELMLIALEMPRLDGNLLIRKFRKDDAFAKTPIVALAKTIDKTTIGKLNDFGIKDVLTKPLDLEKVLPIVEKYYKLKVIAELLRDD